jgi:hypothetical protein
MPRYGRIVLNPIRSGAFCFAWEPEARFWLHRIVRPVVVENFPHDDPIPRKEV